MAIDEDVYLKRNWAKTEAERQRDAWNLIESLSQKADEELDALKLNIKTQEKIHEVQNDIVVLLNDAVAMLKDVAAKQDHNADLLFQLLQRKKDVMDKEKTVLDELDMYLKDRV
jgi:hypothetical protein